jgi:hypothetical protein
VILSYELLLVLVVLGLYLKDATWLLHADEAVLVTARRGRWQAGFGLQNWRLCGKEPFLANPFLPHRPMFRLRWSMEALPEQKIDGQFPDARLLATLAWLAPFAWISWVMLIVVIPASLLTGLGGQVAIAAVVVLYLNILAALATVACLRHRLGLAPRQVGALAFDVIACAPYSINLVRRVCAARAIDEDFACAAARLLASADLRDAHRQCLLRLDEEILSEPEEGTRAARLHVARARLADEVAGAP